jgi:hypothetical protein
MGSTTKILITGSLVFGALTCLASYSLPTAAAEVSAEAAILEEQLRGAARDY